MSEASYEAYLMAGLKRLGGHVMKHNDISAGVPDVSACFGFSTQWIEIKASSSWPKRPATPVRWPHYTELQAHFLRSRGGWLTARIGREYLLWDHERAWALWLAGGWPKERMIAESAYYAKNQVDFLKLRQIIWPFLNASVATTARKAPAAPSAND